MIKDYLWSIFGNDEEPFPPDWYKRDNAWFPFWYRFQWLFIRNPLHNLAWHIIGFVGELDSWYPIGDYKDDVWNPKGGWNKITWFNKKTNKKKIFRSYRGKYIEFYFGPRERGNYGVALRRAYS